MTKLGLMFNKFNPIESLDIPESSELVEIISVKNILSQSSKNLG